MGSNIACTKLCRIPILLVRGEGGGGGGGVGGGGGSSTRYRCVQAVITGSHIPAYAQVKCISNHRTYKIGYHIALPVCIVLRVYI